MARDNIMMYRSQCEAMKQLPPEQFKAVVTALWDYEMDGIVPSGDPVVTAMFMMAKPLIDKRNQAYENGKKGGRPKTEPKPNHNPNVTESKPDNNLSITEPNLKVKGKRLNDKDNKDILSDCKTIIDYLNEKAGTAFREKSRDTRGHINARLSEGFTVDDFKAVIDKKVAEWAGTEMAKYLRPATLFGSKFESYLNQQEGKKKPSNRFDNFEGRRYNFDDLQAQFMRKQAGVE